MNLSTRFRQRGAILGAAALLVMAAGMPFMGQAQDATPAPAEDELVAQGEEIFESVCIACHQPGGEGVTGIFPPLNGNPLLTGEDPTYFIDVVLNGRGGMPRFNTTYDDTEIASVVTYVRQAWDNEAGPVSPEQVAEVRGPVEDDPEGATPTPEGQAPSEGALEGTPEATPAG